jgi:ABC-2 type transport system permease protein
MLSFYLTAMKISVLEQFQYPVANYFYMIGMIAEPVIYLVVWSTVARSQGGSVGGYTPGQFAAYYIVWTLVRNMNIVFTPYGWEWRIQRGQLSGELLRPIHPLHRDVAYFAGWKVVVIVLCLLGMITFWTTRVGAIYELFFAIELVVSGRLVPMTLMPLWVQQVSGFLPFQWTFYFPIQALVGNLSPLELLSGLGMQLLWIVIGVVGVNFLWRLGIRRYSAVGN